MRLAIDVMGGDQGPRAIIEGSAKAVIERPDIELTLFGPRQRIIAELSRLPQPLLQFAEPSRERPRMLQSMCPLI